MERILFVCTGNTCRSPMAEALLKQLANDTMEVKSAGLFAFPGSDASDEVKTVLKRKGIPIEHRAQMLSEELVNWASLILTMTESHKKRISASFPHAIEKTFTVKEYTENSDGDISDPFGGSLEIYEKTAAELEQLVEQVYKKLTD